MSLLRLSDALSRAAIELKYHKNLCADLQRAISSLALAQASGEGTPLAPNDLQALQSLDRMTQELEELAPLLERLSFAAIDGDNPNVWAEAMQVRLASLRFRVLGAGDAGPFDLGEPELF